MPELTVYVQREHDVQLRELLSAPAGPVMLVLVGGSSTGKTRAAFEAVRQCLADWSLLRPLDAADLLDQLRGGAVGPQMVLWLNETQIFLRGQPDVAVALRRLLARDEPVVVIGRCGPSSGRSSRPHQTTARGREPSGEGAAAARRRPGGCAGDVHGQGPAQLRRVRRRPAPGNCRRGSGADGKVVQVLAWRPRARAAL